MEHRVCDKGDGVCNTVLLEDIADVIEFQKVITNISYWIISTSAWILLQSKNNKNNSIFFISSSLRK